MPPNFNEDILLLTGLESISPSMALIASVSNFSGTFAKFRKKNLKNI